MLEIWYESASRDTKKKLFHRYNEYLQGRKRNWTLAIERVLHAFNQEYVKYDITIVEKT